MRAQQRSDPESDAAGDPAFEYGGSPSIGRHLGWLMGEAADGLLDPRDFDLVLPVPFHAQRERERGGATYRVMFPA